MKKLMLIISMLVCALAACSKKTDYNPEQERQARIEAQQFRVESLKAQAHACDKNDGIKDVPEQYCGRYGCSNIVIQCNDGMQRVFPK